METYSNLEKLSNDLKNLFQNQNKKEKEEESYFDFEIICEQNQTSFKTHKSILSSRSEYFKSLFDSKMKEYQENKLILKDVSSPILFSILNYFYSGKIEINLENAVEILIFSSKYLIDELIEICSNFVKKNFQFETIVDILKLSESRNLNQLIDPCYQFIFENLKEFIKTSFFLELEENHLNSILSNNKIPINEFELFQSIVKWGKHKSNINQIPNIIDKIRFIDFKKEELEETLKEDLIPNQISEKLIQFQKLQNGNDEKELDQFVEKENSLIFKPRIRFKSEILEEIEHLRKLKEWINDDEFFSKMKLGYSGKRDGFNCQNWHYTCDNHEKTLIIIKTKDNFIFGGFTEVGFTNSSFQSIENWGNVSPGWIWDLYAFIFSLRNDKNDRKPEKFPIKKEHSEYALYYDFYSKGPNFGGFDLTLESNLKTGFSNLGYNYQLPNGIEYHSDEAQHYLAGSYDKWEVDELETFFI
ncbi:btb/poz domain-containing protein [Anaeramoeba ignava]|uniref:Btb/poz domain-containing protein n=1 Tax=Anaeramoeba ignava TaxID=1746090 RepID=A0A9Q0LIJ6_ANAIG|nr:btb/poz domain-containing protein [Anaeramoeba ignava]